MKRGILIILFLICLLFIVSGIQSCQPTLTIGSSNTCCTLSRYVMLSGWEFHCINDISQNHCDDLYNSYGLGNGYFTNEYHYTNLENSCNDILYCTYEYEHFDSKFMSCVYDGSIYENGESICLENEMLYACIYGKWIVLEECSSSCSNTIDCSNTNIIKPGVMCSDSDEVCDCDIHLCSTTDGGNNIYVKGTDTYYDIENNCEEIIKTDYCLDQDTLREYVCRASYDIDCPNDVGFDWVCVDGACTDMGTIGTFN